MSVKRVFFAVVLGMLTVQFMAAQRLAPLETVPLLELPRQDNDALKIQELEARQPGRPQEFATRVEISVNPETVGVWEILPGDVAVWRYRVRSAGALSLNYGFTEYFMPAGGELLLYSPDEKYAFPPFTSQDNESHGQLWTPILPGEETVFEVRIPAQRRGDLRLQLKYAHHDYIGFGAARPASGSCNLDVICGASDGWGMVDPHRDIIQATGAFHMNGISVCSGALINNVRNDCTPYYLTADHCGIGTNNAASVVVYWNYQNSFCRQPNSPASGQPGDGQLNQFNSGAIFRAGYSPSDVTLIELDDPLDPTHDPYLAGWNRERVVPTSMIGIHHPGVEEKRISFDNDPGIISGWNQPTDSTHVQVNDWDVGTTEGGSSGSPLFDQNERIIGQLTGGGALCGNNLEDQYGWMAVSWEGGGTPSSRLKDWLDPDNTGALVMDGKSCSFTVTSTPEMATLCVAANTSQAFTVQVSGGFVGNVNLSVGNLPTGATASYSMNPVPPGDTSTVTIGNLGGLAAGSYTFTLFGTDGVETDSTDLMLDIFTAAPAQPSPVSPSNGQTAVPVVAGVSWSGTANAFEVEVATDTTFANVVDQATGLTSNSFTTNPLAAQTTYYWRVRGTNICGPSPWSPVFSFFTDLVSCANIAGTNLPVNISPNLPVTVTSTLNYGNSGTISDINVPYIRGQHSWISDLTFTLISPAGTRVELVNRACDDEQDFDIGFDDQSANPLPCPYNVGGITSPSQPLSAFNGENPMGTWTLEVADNAFGDGGRLTAWELEICGSAVVGAEEVKEAGRFELYPNPAREELWIQRMGGASAPVKVELLSIQGNRLQTLSWPAGKQRIHVDLSTLSAGFYFLSIERKGQRWVEKVMVTR